MKYDVIIIGAGPAGYVAAIRAGQVGLKTALVEKKYIGGMCLNWGCIPTKTLIESGKFFNRLSQANEFGINGIDTKLLSFDWKKAIARVEKIVTRLSKGIEYLLKKNGIDIIIGEAVINGQGSVTVNNRHLSTDHIIIATGSYPQPVNTTIGNDKIIEVEKLYSLENLPDEIILYGRGPSIAELAQFFNFIGKNVTVILNDNTLVHDADKYISDFLYKKLKSQKIKIIHADEITYAGNGYFMVGENKIIGDKIINLNYRHATVPASKTEIKLTSENFIKVDENLQTNIPGVYAVGDVNGISYLAHAASAQGIWIVNHIKGIKNILNMKLYPLNIYTSPEMAQIGYNEIELKSMGYELKINEYPLTANAKAIAEGNNEGSIRILSDAKYGQVLGVQIIAEHATDMIAEASAYMQFEGTVYDIAQTIHAHPTISEIFMEAGFDAFDKAIHR